MASSSKGSSSGLAVITSKTKRLIDQRTEIGIVRYISVTDACIKLTVLHTSPYDGTLYTYLIYNRKNTAFVERLKRGIFINVAYEKKPFYKR